MVSTSTWHAGGLGSIPGHGRHGMFGVKPLGICIPHESENHINVSPVSIWDVKEPLSLRTTSTLAVTTLSARIERSAGLNVLKMTD